LAALAATSAFAQSSVTMYGTLDVGVLTQNHGVNAEPNSASTFAGLPTNVALSNRVTGMASSNLTPSKWGIKGVEDMGGGMKTSFVLESALNINTGNNPNGRLTDSLPGTGTVTNNGEGSIQGQMFDREASLGISGSWGELKMGRMTTTMSDTIGAYDPLRASYASSPLGFNGGYGAAGFTGEGRWDNSFKYTKAFGATTLNLNYKTAGTTNGLKQGEAMGAALEYAQGNYGVKGSWSANRDAMLVSSNVTGHPGTANGSETAYPSVAIKFGDTNAFALVGRLTQDKLTYKGGYEVITTKNPQNAAYDSTTNIPAVNGIPVTYTNVSAYSTNLTQKAFWIGANYDVTSQWELSGAVYRRNDAAYGSQTDDSKATYYGLQSQYKLSPRTKVYATYMQSHTTGPSWSAGVPNIQTYTAGIVHSF
jgi:predicted porin